MHQQLIIAKGAIHKPERTKQLTSISTHINRAKKNNNKRAKRRRTKQNTNGNYKNQNIPVRKLKNKKYK